MRGARLGARRGAGRGRVEEGALECPGWEVPADGGGPGASAGEVLGVCAGALLQVTRRVRLCCR
eukprot:2414198-Rhodomonas_salina.1